MIKQEIKERLDDLGIDYTSNATRDELLELLPTDNPTDYDPLATVKLVDKGQGQDLNIVAQTLKAFMKMVKARMTTFSQRGMRLMLSSMWIIESTHIFLSMRRQHNFRNKLKSV